MDIRWDTLRTYAVKCFQIMNGLVGPYPYQQYSVVQAGDGGMEYPMATMIVGKGSQRGLISVTVHESIHSWFQGLLATNESKYAWMDEGFTTYAQHLVMDSLYGDHPKNPHRGSYASYFSLAESGLPLLGRFTVPNSVKAITPLVGQILVERETRHSQDEVAELHLFYNRPTSGAVYAPVHQRLLPLDENWRRRLAELPWPTGNLPEVMGGGTATLRALIREYLFVSLFRACAESLASENASRLEAMQRAENNIDELLEHLNGTFHRLRQSGIDEELFDVTSGFEALTCKGRRPAS